MSINFTVKDSSCISNNILNNIYKKNNNIQIKIWDNKSFEEYIKEKDTTCYNCFLKLNKKFGAMIRDYIRYCILYFEGGVYLDSKSAIKSIDMDSFINTKHYGLHLWRWTQKSFDEYLNWFIICEKGNKIMKKVIDTINYNIINYKKEVWDIRCSKQNVLRFTGPRLFTTIIDNNKHLDKILIYNNKNTKDNLCYNALGVEYKKYYEAPHYSSIKEHLIL